MDTSSNAPGESRYLLVACSSGLCNRMLGIAGSLRIAELTGRDLLLHWPTNRDLGCAFDRLFTNRLRLFRERDVEYLLATHVTVKVYNAWHTRGPEYTDMRSDGDPDTEIVLVKPWMHPKFTDEWYDPDLRAKVRPYLRSLQPRPAILETVGRFPLPELCVGVHIRRGSKCVEQARSKDEHFERIMRALIEQHHDLRFFLATDDPGTEAEFCRRFAGRIAVFPKRGGGRGTVRGMEEALTDLLLLSRTRAILGNSFSSYTTVASFLEDRPVVIAEERSSGETLPSTLTTFGQALT